LDESEVLLRIHKTAVLLPGMNFAKRDIIPAGGQGQSDTCHNE